MPEGNGGTPDGGSKGENKEAPKTMTVTEDQLNAFLEKAVAKGRTDAQKHFQSVADRQVASKAKELAETQKSEDGWREKYLAKLSPEERQKEEFQEAVEILKGRAKETSTPARTEPSADDEASVIAEVEKTLKDLGVDPTNLPNEKGPEGLKKFLGEIVKRARTQIEKKEEGDASKKEESKDPPPSKPDTSKGGGSGGERKLYKGVGLETIRQGVKAVSQRS